MKRKFQSSEDVHFQVGGRYRNRLGWYEVLDIEGSKMTFCYESDGRKDTSDIALQQRIFFNISAEEEKVTPYDETDYNKQYFKTLGYLTKKGFIEAIIPPKSKDGFDSTYYGIKRQFPQDNQPGYYVHDQGVDKWGTEMRLTFKIPKTISENELAFGPSVNVRESPNRDELRINKNSLCWYLLEIGFNLGSNHDTNQIKSNIPEKYKENFQKGISII